MKKYVGISLKRTAINCFRLFFYCIRQFVSDFLLAIGIFLKDILYIPSLSWGPKIFSFTLTRLDEERFNIFFSIPLIETVHIILWE